MTSVRETSTIATPPSCGLLLVDKPAGPSSHDVVGWVRWLLGERAVGHCGTLDPGATGLLVLTVGAATRCATWLSAADKTYEAEFLLGRSTTTDDADGELCAVAEVAPTLAPVAVAALKGMVGRLDLPPPRYSAVQVGGERAYALARQGVEIELACREMTVHELEVLAVEPNEHASLIIRARLRVSKGTYIRALARELGQRLAVPASLLSLRRLACGDLSLHQTDTSMEPVIGTLLATRLAALPARRSEPSNSALDDSAIRGAAGKPKWRLRFADDPEREEAAKRLRAALVAPWKGLGIKSLRVDQPLELEVVRRLSMGNQLAAGEEGFAWLDAALAGHAELALYAEKPRPSATALADLDSSFSAKTCAHASGGPNLATFVVVGRATGRGGKPVIGPVAVILRDPAHAEKSSSQNA